MLGMDVTSSSISQRASQVCLTCRARKKACDKKLPTCGYCLRRGIACKYDDGASARSRGNTAITVTSVLAVRSAMLAVLGSSGSASLQALTPESQASLDGSQSLTLAGTLHNQVIRIIQSLDISVDHIGALYFQYWHPSFQIIAPQLFQEALQEQVPPAADVSILLLAICLVTVESPRDELYMAARMLFTSVQATTTYASIALLQAALLVSSYEYARGWLDTASISIAQCVRMGYSLGINKYSLESSSHQTRNERSSLMQSWNLWWGAMMLDSIILSEADPDVQQPPAGFLTQDTPIPFNLSLEASSFTPPSPITLGTVDVQNTNDFGRQARAVFLLYRLRQAIYTGADLAELAGIDMEIQQFLISITAAAESRSNNHHSEALHSTSVAIAVRSLFILHQHILTRRISPGPTLPSHSSEMEALKQASSQAALCTAAKMVIDAAADHSHSITMITHALPFCCRRNVRDTKKIWSSSGWGSEGGLQYIALVERTLDRRWGEVH